MGMYTELYLTVELKEDVPQDIIDILTVICGGKRLEEQERKAAKEQLPDLEIRLSKGDLPDGGRNIFSSDRIFWLGSSTSYYFAGDPIASLRKDAISRSYHMTLRGDIKNYGDEIEEFLKWLQAYVEPRHYAGHIRYEEDYAPTLIFFNKSGMRLADLSSFMDYPNEGIESDDE